MEGKLDWSERKGAAAVQCSGLWASTRRSRGYIALEKGNSPLRLSGSDHKERQTRIGSGKQGGLWSEIKKPQRGRVR